MAADPRYSKRLAIVVPYRDRAQHLAQFVPHMIMYFERDKLDRQIAVTINIIEQTPGAPFSRGRLGNAGFLLTRATVRTTSASTTSIICRCGPTIPGVPSRRG